MKSPITLFLLLLFSPFLRATNAGVTTVTQPVNLVGDSLAGCIPLTSAACYANYDYGIHRMISAPQPFLHEAKSWAKGTESNSNLASVFGIEVRPTDGTSIRNEPVEIHIKDWAIPAYSPHSKAEVLAATIHCLLQSSHATPDHPLDIKVITENKEDQSWAAPFTKKYVRSPGQDGLPVTPTPVGDSVVITDGFGVCYVISKKLNPKGLMPKIAPVILPFSFAESSDGMLLPGLIPFWPGNGSSDSKIEPLQSLGLSRSHFYNLFSNGVNLSLEFNPLYLGNQYFSTRTNSEHKVVEFNLSVNEQALEDISATIAAAAITSRASHNKAVQVTIGTLSENEPLLKFFLDTPGWEKSMIGNRQAVTALFDYDPKKKSLRKGTLPGGVTIGLYASGRIFLSKNGE